MKIKKPLLSLSFLLLLGSFVSGCTKVDTSSTNSASDTSTSQTSSSDSTNPNSSVSSDSSSSDETSSSSLTEEEKLRQQWKNNLEKLNTNLHLQGKISYQFYDSETKEPSQTAPVTSDIDLYYTSDAFQIVYEGDFDDDSREILFKSSDNTVELRVLNLQNEVDITRPKDDNGDEYSFTPYTNPFTRFDVSNLDIEDSTTASLLNQSEADKTLALSIVFGFTNYTFPEIASIQFKGSENGITDIEITSPILSETMRTGVYSFSLKIVESGSSVVGPQTPTPLTPNDNQKILKTGLEELDTKDYKARLEITDYGYGYDVYKTDSCILVTDTTDPRYTFGFMKDSSNKVYEISYDRTNKVIARYSDPAMDNDGNAISWDSVTPPWTILSEVYFNYDATTNSFTLDKAGESYAGYYAYLVGCSADLSLYTAESVKFNLDENNKIASMEATGEYIGEPITLTFSNLGNVTLPIDLENLPVITE